MGPTNYHELALRVARAEFVAACPFPLLVGGAHIRKPDGPSRTMGFDAETTESLDVRRAEALKKGAAPPLVRAVRKVQEVFPSMITVGRTQNNDVVIEDVQVSKFHAAFRVDGPRLHLADHGSKNGTWVGIQRLVPNGPSRPVPIGESVRFGKVEFTLLDAGTCWDLLRRVAARR